MLCIIFKILCVVNNFDIQNIKKKMWRKIQPSFPIDFFFSPFM